MPDIKIIVALTVAIMYLRWEFVSPYVNPRTGKPGSKAQRLIPFLGFIAAAILVQAAVTVDTPPYSFVLLGFGGIALFGAIGYGIFRRLPRSRNAN